MQSALPVTGAFLAVAFADGRYDPLEERRFLSTIANAPALSGIRTEALQEAYNMLRAEIETDYPSAAAKILAAIAAAKGDMAIVEAVKVAARGAIVADRRLAPQEEVALDRIAAALGLEAGAV
ncbi:MAG: TerB family tellurite resistance protein [Amphiplicatus sp.]